MDLSTFSLTVSEQEGRMCQVLSSLSAPGGTKNKIRSKLLSGVARDGASVKFDFHFSAGSFFFSSRM